MIDIYDNRDNLIEELDLLEKLRLAYLRRKLTPGLLLVPEGIDYSLDDEESFADLLANEMVRTIQVPNSLGTVVPIVVQGPTELLDQVKFIKFHDDSMLDVAQIEERIDKLKERIKRFDEFTESMVQ